VNGCVRAETVTGNHFDNTLSEFASLQFAPAESCEIAHSCLPVTFFTTPFKFFLVLGVCVLVFLSLPARVGVLAAGAILSDDSSFQPIVASQMTARQLVSRFETFTQLWSYTKMFMRISYKKKSP